MTQLKIIGSIILIIFLFLGVVMWRQESIINDLQLTISEKEKIIVQQNNKIENQLTEINLLTADLETKKLTIESLQESVIQASLNNEELIKNLQELSKIENPKLIKNIEEETTEIINNNGVTINETDKQFIDLRNNIYKLYE